MYIPSSALKSADFTKGSKIGTSKAVFGDKIVSAQQSPLLYSIESARRKMLSVMNNQNPDIKMSATKVSSDRGYLARDMLLLCNVSYVVGEREFSLLREQSDKKDIKNKNMTDSAQYEETFNQNTTAEDKYKYTQDPFYKSDENQVSNQAYAQEVNEKDQIARPPDLSRIASGIAVKNLLSQAVTPTTKYFIQQASPVGFDGEAN